MHTASLLLLADLVEVLQSLIPIIFVILYGIAHLVGALQQEKKRSKAKPRPQPAPAELASGNRPGVNPAGKPENLEDSLRREVEEFLKRAQGQPQQQPAKAPQARPPQRNQPRPLTDRGQQRPLRPPERSIEPAKPRRLVETVAVGTSAAPNEPLPSLLGAPPAPTGSTRHIGDPLRTQPLTQHAQSLGADIAQADERMEEHLRQTFVHPVGTLAARRQAAAHQQAASSPAAQEIRNLLTRPGGIQQLVVASEILRRPGERWEQ